MPIIVHTPTGKTKEKSQDWINRMAHHMKKHNWIVQNKPTDIVRLKKSAPVKQVEAKQTIPADWSIKKTKEALEDATHKELTLQLAVEKENQYRKGVISFIEKKLNGN